MIRERLRLFLRDTANRIFLPFPLNQTVTSNGCYYLYASAESKFCFPPRKKSCTKGRSEMFAESIENFRKNKGLTVAEFCEVTRFSEAQYNRYRSGTSPFLQINDAARLLAGFPDDISVFSLCRMCEISAPKIDSSFTSLSFFVPHGFYKSNKRIRRFVLSSFRRRFDMAVLADLYGSLACDIDFFSDEVIRLGTIARFITRFSLYSLMYSLRTVRGLTANHYDLPVATVNAHLQRRTRISRFSDLCMYERKFDSGGVFLFLEMLYSMNRIGCDVFLRAA